MNFTVKSFLFYSLHSSFVAIIFFFIFLSFPSRVFADYTCVTNQCPGGTGQYHTICSLPCDDPFLQQNGNCYNDYFKSCAVLYCDPNAAPGSVYACPVEKDWSCDRSMANWITTPQVTCNPDGSFQAQTTGGQSINVNKQYDFFWHDITGTNATQNVDNGIVCEISSVMGTTVSYYWNSAGCGTMRSYDTNNVEQSTVYDNLISPQQQRLIKLDTGTTAFRKDYQANFYFIENGNDAVHGSNGCTYQVSCEGQPQGVDINASLINGTTCSNTTSQYYIQSGSVKYTCNTLGLDQIKYRMIDGEGANRSLGISIDVYYRDHPGDAYAGTTTTSNPGNTKLYCSVGWDQGNRVDKGCWTAGNKNGDGCTCAQSPSGSIRGTKDMAFKTNNSNIKTFKATPGRLYRLDAVVSNNPGTCHARISVSGLSCPPPPPSTGSVQVNLYNDPNWDRTGTGPYGGTVQLQGIDTANASYNQTLSNANGNDLFTGVPNGNYKITFTFPGRFLTDNPPTRQENSLIDTSIKVTGGNTTPVTYHTAPIPSATLSPGTASCTVPYNAAAGGYNPDQCSVNVAYRVNNVPSAYARINKSPWPSGFEPTFGSTGYITPIINLDTSFNDTIQYKFAGQPDGLSYSYWASIVPGATNNPFYIGPLSTNVTRNAVHGPQTFNTVSGGIFWDNNVNSQYDPPASGTPDSIPYDDPNDAERLTVTIASGSNTYSGQSTLPPNPSYSINVLANPGYTMTTTTPAGYSGAYVEAPSTFDVPSAGPITRRIAVKGYQMQGKVCIDGTGGNPVDGICQAGETLMPGSATITVTTNGGLPLPTRTTTTNTGNPQAGKNYQIKNLRGGGQGYNVTISNLPSGYTLNSPATVAVIVNSTLGNADFAVVGSYNLDVTVKLTDAAGNCTVDPGANQVGFTLHQFDQLNAADTIPGFPKTGSYGSGAPYSFGSLQALNYELSINFSGNYANYHYLSSTVSVPPPSNNSYPVRFQPLAANESVVICITSSAPWWQVTSGDVRMNKIRNQIPGSQFVSFGNGTLNSNGTAYSMLFSSKGVIDMGSGSSRSGSNTKAWVFDNESTYNPNNETINSAGSLSFSRLNSIAVNIPKVNYAGPSIPATQAVPGSDAAYYINNSVTLSGGVSIGGSNKVIILVKGDVTITGNIIVAPGALLLVAASGNITIDSAIGDSNYGLNTTNFDGIFTAEGNITINGTTCSAGVADPMLRVGGALIANAAQPFSTSGAGGKFINNRSLCANDATTPTVKIFQRPDFIFVLPDIIKKKITITKEVQP